MAYLRDLPSTRCPCGKPARVELVNRRNSPLSSYCRRCGARELARRQKRELAADALGVLSAKKIDREPEW